MSGRLARLFEAAVELPPAQRAELLARECGDDAELRARVEALLAADATPAAVAFDALLAPPSVRLAPGTVVAGRYRIEAVRGEGGMGIVYTAEQFEPRRRVALKCLRPGAHAPATVQRFAREAELMARLRHPGIAQVYEAGELDDGSGQPFFAMEFVDGAPLLEALAGAPLATRLAVFEAICEAVQQAHAVGIVHRDLKPSNLLVERAGDQWQPKVLDFGIARALADDDGLTRTHELVGTLAYLGPEQFAGAAVASPRSDVWALGVTLYQLLSGRLPFALDGLPLAVAAQRLAADEPTRIERLVPALRGDLATIVHKALAKDPGRRYADAGELAADLARHRLHEPIAARPPSALYQATRFAQRHRGPVAGLAIAFLALATALGWSLHAAGQEAAQRRAAEQLATELRLLVRDVVFEVDEQLAPLPAATAARGALVAAGNRYVERLLQRTEPDAGLWFELGAVLRKLGGIQGVPGGANLGDAAAAEATLRRALDAFGRARAAGSTQPSLHEQIVAATRDLADVLRTAGRGAEGLAALQALAPVVEEERRVRGAPAAERLQAMVRPNAARLRLEAGDRAGARAEFEQHRAALSARIEAGEPALLRELSVVEQQLAELAVGAREPEAAAAMFEQSLAHAEGAAGRAGARPIDREQLASALQSWGQFVMRRDGPAAARPHLERALAVLAEPALDDPANVQRGRTRGLLEYTLADLLLRAGDTAAARGFAEAFRDRTLALRRLAPDYQSLHRDLGVGHELLGRIAAAEGDEDAVEREFAAALAMLQARRQERPQGVPERADLARTYGQLAVARNTLANAQADDRERGRLYVAVADAMAAKVELLQALQQEGKLAPDLQKDLATSPDSITRLRAAAAALTR